MEDKEIKDRLDELELPKERVIALDDCCVCGDIPMMVETHLGIIGSDCSDKIKRPYRLRLISLIKYLESNE